MVARQLSVLMTAVVVAAGLTGLAAPTASAASCPPASVGGKAIGSVDVGDVSVPLKPVSYVPGGVLSPPASNRVAGLSTVNAPLHAKEGTTVITWHVRYGEGCPGTLNPLLRLAKGQTFTVTDARGVAATYRVTGKTTVPKGQYRASWFRVDGPHRLALFTCADLADGKFRKTTAVFAEPLAQ